MLTGLLIGLALAAGGPIGLVEELEVPVGVRVEASAQGEHWHFVVTSTRTRTLEVDSPDTEEERQAILALLESLLVDLSLPAREPDLPAKAPASAVPSPSASLPAPRERPVAVPATEETDTPELFTLQDLAAMQERAPLREAPRAQGTLSPHSSAVPVPEARAAAPTAAPPGPTPASAPASSPLFTSVPLVAPALATERPELPARGWFVPWVALDAASRPGAALAPGGALGAAVAVGPVLGMGISGSYHPRRALSAAPRASFSEETVDLEVLLQPRPWVRVWGGAGCVVRSWVQYDVRVQRSVTARSSVGLGLTLPLQGLVLTGGTALDLDLARTRFVDEEGAARLFPLNLRPLLRVEFRGNRRTPMEDPDIGEAGARESEAPQ